LININYLMNENVVIFLVLKTFANYEL